MADDDDDDGLWPLVLLVVLGEVDDVDVVRSTPVEGCGNVSEGGAMVECL